MATILYVKVTHSEWSPTKAPRHFSHMIWENRWGVEYTPQAWTYPSTPFKSKLFLYKNLDALINEGKYKAWLNDVNQYDGCLAWWCEALRPIAVDYYQAGLTESQIQDYWNLYALRGTIPYGTFPKCHFRKTEGVILADAVRLVSLITDTDFQTELRKRNGR